MKWKNAYFSDKQTTVLKKHVSGEIQNSNLQYILKFLKENNKWFL